MDDELDDAGLSDLAATMRSEWRSDYEETAGEARMQWEHGRSFLDRVQEVMARGDRVALEAGDMRFTGSIVDLGSDWCTIAAPGGPVDVRLSGRAHHVPLVMRQLERGRSGGRRAPQPPISFRARCYELEMESAPVCVGTMITDEPFTGTLVVGSDHLMVRQPDGDVWIPIEAVGWIMPA